jgi:hypothetical protein
VNGDFINFRFSNMWKFVTGAGRRSLRQKNLKKIAKRSMSWFMCQEMDRLHIFAPFNPELLGAL